MPLYAFDEKRIITRGSNIQPKSGIRPSRDEPHTLRGPRFLVNVFNFIVIHRFIFGRFDSGSNTSERLLISRSVPVLLFF